jgi:dephospho-CoA kinase
MKKVIGLTGGFGTGKTFVASVFKSLGATVLDADKLARDAVAKGRPAYKNIVRLFGKDILDSSKNIDRPKLAAIVFTDKVALKRLNRIVHPVVIAKIKSEIKRLASRDVVVVDAPLLIEANLAGIADVLVVVKCSKKEQIERCMRKFRMEKRDVLRRIASQMPMNKKIGMADFVVDNSGGRSVTKKQLRKVWKEILWR